MALLPAIFLCGLASGAASESLRDSCAHAVDKTCQESGVEAESTDTSVLLQSGTRVKAESTGPCKPICSTFSGEDKMFKMCGENFDKCSGCKACSSGPEGGGGGDMPSGGDDMPSDGDDMPSGGDDMPSDGDDMPSGGDDMPPMPGGMEDMPSGPPEMPGGGLSLAAIFKAGLSTEADADVSLDREMTEGEDSAYDFKFNGVCADSSGNPVTAITSQSQGTSLKDCRKAAKKGYSNMYFSHGKVPGHGFVCFTYERACIKGVSMKEAFGVAAPMKTYELMDPEGSESSYGASYAGMCSVNGLSRNKFIAVASLWGCRAQCVEKGTRCAAFAYKKTGFDDANFPGNGEPCALFSKYDCKEKRRRYKESWKTYKMDSSKMLKAWKLDD